MTLNLYVMPITGSGTRQSPRQPKYTSTFAAFSWGMFDYGNEPWCLVGILNIDGTTDSTLDGEPDVTGLPLNLDTQVGGARSTVETKLEAVDMPGTWVQTSDTWRDVVLFIGAACQFAQRFQGTAGGRWFTGSITLDTTFNTLPAGVRSALQSTAQSLGLNTSGITGTSTLRQIIQNAAQQLVTMNTPLVLAGGSLLGMSVLATDSFTGANANPIGGNWTTIPGGFSALQRISNTVGLTSGDSGAYYNAVVWPNDQYSQVKMMTSGAGGNNDCGPGVRISSSAASFYWVNNNDTSTHLYKVVSFGFTQINFVSSNTFAVNDTIRIEAQGTTIRYSKNGGAALITQVDSALSSGNAGIGDIADSAVRFDDWEGGDFAAAAQDTPELRGRPFGLRGQTQMHQLLAT